ncbi:MAG TPA: peptidoglycan recognition family protein [Solirubrobacterales bacterium]|nr:peptidoglycan recognition family protein [Solirubrobacterales bacterium]
MKAPQPEVTRNVVNQSSRDGKRPSIIVLHTTEGHNRPGVGDLADLAAFFDRTSTQASSHIANDAEGHDCRMVPDSRKAWTQAELNSVALSIEQIGFAAQGKGDWFGDAPHQLANTARWIAWWSKKYGIPIRRGVVSGTTVLKSGVCSHKQLGAAGGGHVDPGTAYPFEYVLDLARVFASRRGSKARKEALADVNRVRRHFGLAPMK